ncbi:ROK family protein [Actinopolymorpha rutila]|uniref:Putative NBD/HSP70 family sugar kinase n=1 Tax=Actinopolymorpha rutila TaxID=446787 RepID=A0A852ZX32_9ACTN|nr:ROK family protein [Actinopolymorpha rutila]NYH93276.1 putative NBD/HSP70 family sugar kinase [Actinopolymorpha rutila]
MLGIDIGVYRLEVVVTDLVGTPLATRVRQLDPTMTRPRRLRAARQLSTAVLEDIDATAADLRAIGVGTPGIVDGETGSVTFCNAMPGWSGLALAAEVRNAFGCTVAVENDANLAVVGECWKGAARGFDDVVLLMAGERIGAGIVIGGSLVRGKRGGTGEMTFLGMLRDSNPTEGIQEFVHTAARRQVDHLVAGGDARSDAVRTLVRDLEPLHGVHVGNLDTMLASVQRGKATALRQLETALARLCAVSIAVTTLISPELFVLGGRAPAAEELILPPIVEVLHGISGAGVEPPQVVVSSLGESAVALGAAHKALDLVEATLLDALA